MTRLLPRLACATLTATMLAVSTASAQRTIQTLEEGWRFTRDDSPSFAEVHYADQRWQSVTIPHDWAIYGPFSYLNDKQNLAISQDGQKEAMEHAGRTGGLPFVGAGWYRRSLELPEHLEGRRVRLVFDGAMSHAEVYINGQRVGYWPYGYNSFHFDITPYVRPGKHNTLAVRLSNLHESSRWYPGAGLYRHVHLITTDDLHVAHWGQQITTSSINKEYANVNLRVGISGLSRSNRSDNLSIETTIIGSKGREQFKIKSSAAHLTWESDSIFSITHKVSNPKLWDIKQPNLYKSVVALYRGDQLIDSDTTTFGIRSIEMRQDEGFFLNGRKVKFQGVCLHHDQGPLGAVVNEASYRRQIRIMQDMGVNAIRTSHNMPAPEFVRLCDEMGMMVMAESFDCWLEPKVPNGYNLNYAEWHEKDLVNLLHQFRNSASIVMWCIGNEVSEQWRYEGVKRARILQNICHREDPTRPVTNGMDNPLAVMHNGMAALLDVPGFNYRPHLYDSAHRVLPHGYILGSETASTVSSRGVYKFPVERKSMARYPDHQSSGYDVEHCSWSNLPEDDWMWHEDKPWTMGEFIWTGFDYIGEPTPYYSDWPSHSSLFGAVDLAGIPKDRFYLYRSHWNKDETTLHILPHWTWPGREGETTPVFVYTSYPEAELFVNGKSQGRIKKDTSVTLEETWGDDAKQNLARQRRYRLMWMDVKYTPGTLRVVAYDKDGKPAEVKEVHTATKPHRLMLSVDRQTIGADGKDIAFVRVSLVDKRGTLIPGDERLVSFRVKGAGRFRAAASGNPASLDLFHEPRHHLFSGELTALVQAGKTPGKVTLTASAPGVESASITIDVR